ncbi:MAG: hypothetical protein CVU71_11855 [Deltaproteobacteria bacterium HGW-Deltaproteobacteria-6]|jgi:hypothetical protein|nr:MAG: hypothetical protein CVU71_11855 [Deltaproteobacteria bacterium HGW-Deltaproteobacteria-6]PKN95655.1 MAG: hypothetical protein CVU43_24310 [Chloroflexi bacterium HGW-Chloroflexi-5]
MKKVIIAFAAEYENVKDDDSKPLQNDAKVSASSWKMPFITPPGKIKRCMICGHWGIRMIYIEMMECENRSFDEQRVSFNRLYGC